MSHSQTQLTPPLPYASDAECAALARSGDPHALAALYVKYGSALLTLADRLLVDHSAAEDVLHDVFVGLPEALRHYDERGNLLAWMKRIITRVALNKMRTLRRRAELPIDTAATIQTRASSPADAIALADALARIPDSLRAVFVLKEIEGFTHAEIGEMLHVSRGASEVRHHRAVRALRKILESSR